MQKSKKLAAEEAISNAKDFDSTLGISSLAPSKHVVSGPVKIKVIETANEYIAVLRERHKSDIHLTAGAQFKNEGVVVGVGPGEALAGGRIESQFKIGDNILFFEKYIVLEVIGSYPPYLEQSIVYLSERNVISKLPPVPFEIVK